MTYRLTGERYRGTFAEGLEHDVARRWLDEAHGWFEPVAGEAPADPPAERAPGAARLTLVESPLGLAIAKEVAPGRFAYRRRRRVQRLMNDALHLSALGVATAQPFAALEPLRRGDPAAFVAERVEAPTLGAWARAGAPGDRTALAEAIADTLARMHRGGLRHRDLKAPNVLVEIEVPGVLLLDLDGVRRKSPGIARRSWRCRARDLARLFLSLRVLSNEGMDLDRELWRPMLARYAVRAPSNVLDLDAWARRWADRHERRNRRRGRPTT